MHSNLWVRVALLVALAVGIALYVSRQNPCDKLTERCRSAQERLDLPVMGQCSIVSLTGKTGRPGDCQSVLDALKRVK